jgi:hypothetical protein
MIAWCVGILVVKGFEGIAAIDLFIHRIIDSLKKNEASALQ